MNEKLKDLIIEIIDEYAWLSRHRHHIPDSDFSGMVAVDSDGLRNLDYLILEELRDLSNQKTDSPFCYCLPDEKPDHGNCCRFVIPPEQI